MKYFNAQRLNQLVVFFAFFTLLLGLTVIWGWHTQNISLIKVLPAFVPMQYNTAISFIVAGIGLLMLSRQNRIFTLFTGMLLLLLGGGTLSQYLFGWELGVDLLQMDHSIDHKASYIGQMAFNTALSFSLIGIALLSISTMKKPLVALGIGGNIGVIVFMLGMAALIGYAFGVNESFGWRVLTKMPVHTSLGCMILGAGLFIHSLIHTRQLIGERLPKWLLSASVLAGLSLTIAAWQEARIYESHIAQVLELNSSFMVLADESMLAFGLLLTFICTFFLWHRIIEHDDETEQPTKHSFSSPNRIFVLVIFLGGLLSFAIYQVLQTSFQSNVKTRFNAAIVSHADGIEQGINLYLDAIYDLRTFFIASEEVTQAEFRTLAERDLANLSGLIAIQWAPKITHEQRVEYEATKVLGQSFQVQEIVQHKNLVYSPVKPYYLPVLYVEPLEENLSVLGLDVFTNPYMKKHFDIHNPIDDLYISPQFNLVQRPGVAGMSIQLPVYKDHNVAIAQRELLGVVTMTIDIAEMIEDMLIKFTDPAGIDLVFEDFSADMQSQHLYRHTSPLENGNDSYLSYSKVFNFGHRLWQMTGYSASSERYPSWSWLTLLLPSFTLVFALLLAYFLRSSKLRELERARLLNEVATKEAHYSTLVETIPGTVFIARIEPGYNTEYVSSEVTKLTQYQAEKFLTDKTLNFISITHPDDRKLLTDAIETAALYESELAVEYRLITKLGDERHVYLKGKTLFNPAQKTRYLHATAIDVTERKQSEKQFENLLETAPDAMIITNNLGEIIIVNKQTEALFGYRKEELIGQKIEMLMPNKFRANHPKERNRFFDKPSVRAMGYGSELLGLHNNGQEIPVEISLSPIKTKDGLMVSASIRDVSLRKKMEGELVDALERAQDATQAKSDFLANMSHEIRTPMNSIIGMSYLALQTELSVKQRNYVEKTHQAAESLLGIINDILDFSKIEAGKMTIENVEFDLFKTLDNLANLVGLKAEEKGIELVFDIPADIPRYLVGDPLRLQQILINLGNNAVKFTKQGEVVISIIAEQLSEENAQLKFIVRDTGIGMSAEQQVHLFQSFSQADTSTTRQFGGTGLGLAICKELTDLMGGRIGVTSTQGEGSEFDFSLPFGRYCISKQEQLNSSALLESLNVLVVDDNRASRDILSTILTGFNVNVTSCANGYEAIDLIKTVHQDGRPFNYVFMDWKMPGIDGIETARRVQEDSAIDHVPTFIMVTAFKREEAIEAARDIELEAFLTKPVTASTIHDSLINRGPKQDGVVLAGGNAGVTRLRQALVGSKVLLVEDNEFNQELALELLSLNHIAVDVANNGEQAIEMLQQSDYDGVLMDCQMPVMDGYVATRKIREITKFQDLPIIAMTANAMLGDKEKAIAAGMNDHIAKPINVDSMLDTMEKWIQASSTPSNMVLAVNDNQASTSSAVNPNIHDDETLPSFSFMNTEEALAYCAGSRSLLKKLTLRFADEQVEFVNKLNHLLKQNRQEGAARLAHSLKSSAASLGMGSIAKQAEFIEMNLSATQTPKPVNGYIISPELSRTIDEIARDLEEVVAAIVQYSNQQTEAKQQLHAESNEQIQEKLEQLEQLIASYDVDSIDLIAELRTISNFKPYSNELRQLQRALDEFDFDIAAERLTALKNMFTSP